MFFSDICGKALSFGGENDLFAMQCLGFCRVIAKTLGCNIIAFAPQPRCTFFMKTSILLVFRQIKILARIAYLPTHANILSNNPFSYVFPLSRKYHPRLLLPVYRLRMMVSPSRRGMITFSTLSSAAMKSLKRRMPCVCGSRWYSCSMT